MNDANDAFTLERLDSINKFGLTPRNEDNSKLISDDKVKVFFSEGFEGALALYVDFNKIGVVFSMGRECRIDFYCFFNS